MRTLGLWGTGVTSNNGLPEASSAEMEKAIFGIGTISAAVGYEVVPGASAVVPHSENGLSC